VDVAGHGWIHFGGWVILPDLVEILVDVGDGNVHLQREEGVLSEE